MNPLRAIAAWAKGILSAKATRDHLHLEKLRFQNGYDMATIYLNAGLTPTQLRTAAVDGPMSPQFVQGVLLACLDREEH